MSLQKVVKNWWWRNGICYVHEFAFRAMKSCANLARHFHKTLSSRRSKLLLAKLSNCDYHIYNLLKSWIRLVPKDIFLFTTSLLFGFVGRRFIWGPQRWRKISNKRFFRKVFEIFLLLFSSSFPSLLCLLKHFSLLHKALRGNAQTRIEPKNNRNEIYSLLGLNVLCLSKLGREGRGQDLKRVSIVLTQRKYFEHAFQRDEVGWTLSYCSFKPSNCKSSFTIGGEFYCTPPPTAEMIDENNQIASSSFHSIRRSIEP